MTHIVTRLCLRDTACVEVCPVECMVLGKPEEEWPWLYIDPDTCIDCGACVPECPYEAIFPEEDVPEEHEEVEFVVGGNTIVGDTARNAAYFTDGPGYWDYDLDEERAGG